MLTDNDMYLECLKRKVTEVFNGRLETSGDFERLSQSISQSTKQVLSVSTIKRLWNYVSSKPEPHISTLDILAAYVGYPSFNDFRDRNTQSSAFFSCEKIQSADLQNGDVVNIKWMPDRDVKLKYLGNGQYVVIDCGKSKLQNGDLVECASFLKGEPLFFARVIRGEEELPPYVTGKMCGLTSIEVIS